MKWRDFFRPAGTFVSEIIDVSSEFDYYIINVRSDYISEGDSVIEIEMRHSEDGVNWTDWYDVKKGSPRIFDGINTIKNLLIQYRVVLESDLFFFPQLNFFSVGGGIVYEIENIGDLPHKPKIWIKKLNKNGDISIRNLTSGEELELKGLQKNETVFIDNDEEQIITDVPLTYRYDNHNNVFLTLELRDNLIVGKGDFELDFKMEFQTLA